MGVRCWTTPSSLSKDYIQIASVTPLANALYSASMAGRPHAAPNDGRSRLVQHLQKGTPATIASLLTVVHLLRFF
jgi:hypothetical protein